MQLNDFLVAEFLGNTGKAYLVALGIFLASFIVLKIFDTSIVAFLKRQTKKTKNQWDDIVVDFMSAINWQFYIFLSFYLATRYLTLTETVEKVISIMLLVFVVFYAAQGLSRIVDYFTKQQIEKRKKTDNVQNTSMIKVFGTLFKIVIWVIGVMMLLTNLGIEITPLIAGLGIGGIAIAIALQAVLADLFSAFAIYFDKPFKEGDFIVIGNDVGTVKQIGIKTTRIETLQGQELIVSNSELTSTRVNNYKRMRRRRIVFSFGVEYGTPLKKLKKINEIVKKVLDKVEDATLDRVHFHQFGDFSLNFEVVYFVESADYNIYMDVQQKINFGLKEEFEKEKIEFAFPTQTLHLKNQKE